jgi:hypothetical protein
MDSRKVEWITFRKDGEYYKAQVAIDGRLAMSLEVHASERARYKSDEDFRAMIVRQSESLLSMYGDVRESRLESMEPNFEEATA